MRTYGGHMRLARSRAQRGDSWLWCPLSRAAPGRALVASFLNRSLPIDLIPCLPATVAQECVGSVHHGRTTGGQLYLPDLCAPSRVGGSAVLVSDPGLCRMQRTDRLE